MDSANKTEIVYKQARESFASWGVDTEAALEKLIQIPISLPCWQGDDVGGFETPDASLTGGGIQATGNYPGKARTIAELRADMDKALSLIPGQHRVNLHASYLDNQGQFVNRNEITIEHFQSWIDWAQSRNLGLDFNPTFFSHSNADKGFTLSSPDDDIRKFWIEHGMACRKIAAKMGKQLGSPCVCNIWIPDGYKDTPIDRLAPRQRLSQALDKILAEKFPREHLLDSVESKLFGIGSESYVAGSHDFYLGYAISRGILLCLDTGHYHPTELVADKISSVLMHVDEILLHVSRAVRWDSDHVVTLSDELRSLAEELVRSDFLGRTHIGLDYFDASINRIAAWVIGARNMIKALLLAFLQPLDQLRALENEGDFTARLALLEEFRTLPFGAVWDYYCLKNNVPVGSSWLDEVRAYEKSVLANRT